jgi:hypothetical protein
VAPVPPDPWQAPHQADCADSPGVRHLKRRWSHSAATVR